MSIPLIMSIVTIRVNLLLLRTYADLQMIVEG